MATEIARKTRKTFKTTFDGTVKDDYVLVNRVLKHAKNPLTMREIVAGATKHAAKHSVTVRYSGYFDHVNSLIRAGFVTRGANAEDGNQTYTLVKAE